MFRLVHIVLWILFSSLIALQLNINDSPDGLSLTAATIFTCLYVFYAHFLLLTSYIGKRKNLTYFFKLGGIILTGPLPFLFFHPRGLESLEQSFEFYMMTLLTGVPLFLFLGWLARVTQTLVLNSFIKEQLEKQAVQAELYYLKSQINPHFLFNTLNNIHTLVYKQAPAAPQAVLHLSSLMRYMIYESNADTVPLSREMAYLQDYVSLQQLRYKNASVVNIEIAGDVSTCYIAPLLFIHFLENAYKHSPARLEPGNIRVRLEIKENSLIFTCENPVVNKSISMLEEPGGVGLPNIRKRLQLLYPDTHTLETGNTNDCYRVILRINDLHLRDNERKD